MAGGEDLRRLCVCERRRRRRRVCTGETATAVSRDVGRRWRQLSGTTARGPAVSRASRRQQRRSPGGYTCTPLRIHARSVENSAGRGGSPMRGWTEGWENTVRCLPLVLSGAQPSTELGTCVTVAKIAGLNLRRDHEHGYGMCVGIWTVCGKKLSKKSGVYIRG